MPHGLDAIAPELGEQDFRIDQVLGAPQRYNVDLDLFTTFRFQFLTPYFKVCKITKNNGARNLPAASQGVKLSLQPSFNHEKPTWFIFSLLLIISCLDQPEKLLPNQQ